MQIEIKVADDRMSAKVGEVDLRVNGAITFKSPTSIKMHSGTILAFAIIDKKDMNSPWCYVKENKSGDAYWISLNNWSQLQLPSQEMKEVKAATPEPVNNELSEDDFI